MSKKPQKMPFAQAMSLVPDDLPDGAYWAMAHEIAGIEYGDGFDELDPLKPYMCGHCGKDFYTDEACGQHMAAKHGDKP